MNNQQQVDKKRHGSKIMRSKSLNVTATSLIFPFFSRNSEASIKRERERMARVQMEKEREERKREKNGIFLFGNSNRN
jgi:hypothetical protein